MKVVVIGAGVIGLCCARELARRGAAVTVLDRGRAGEGCSGANSGWIVPSFSNPLPAPGLVRTSLAWMLRPGSPLYIRPRVDPALWSWLWRFWRRCNPSDYAAGLRALAEANRQTLALFDAMRADGVEFELHRSRALFLFLTREAHRAVLDDLRRLAELGYPPPQPLDRDAVRALIPQAATAVVGGIRAPEERHVRPETLTAGLVRRLRSLGVEIHEGVAVTGFDRRGPTVTAARTADGEVRADAFVLAAGAWSRPLGALLGCALPVEAGKGYTITVEGADAAFPGPTYLDEARVAITPLDGAVRLGGTMELSGINARVDPRRLEAIRRGTRRYLETWPRGRTERVWAGMRPITPDGLPLLGRLPRYDNVFVATGHGMYGMTLAPATAVATAAVITGGRAPFDLAPFRADRFAWRG